MRIEDICTENQQRNLFFIFFLLPQVVMLIAQKVIISNSEENINLYTDLSSYQQLILDWNTPFFNEIYTVGPDQRCEFEDEPILASVWFGAEHFCIDDDRIVTKGMTCETAGRPLYECVKEKCTESSPRDNRKDCTCVKYARTDNLDNTGFPLIQ